MPDNEDTFGRQNWEDLINWNQRMREKQVSQITWVFTGELVEQDVELVSTPTFL